MASFPQQYPVPTYLQTIGGLHEWLGKLIAASPSVADVTVFALDGDCLTTEHFCWHTEDGAFVEDPAEADDVTIETKELPYEPDEPTPSEQALFDLRDQLLSIARRLSTTIGVLDLQHRALEEIKTELEA